MILKEIKKKIKSHIKMDFFSIQDNSLFHNHSKNHLTHLQLTIISDDFINKSWIDRHRIIFSILKNIQKKIYSITLHTYTILEWKHKKERNLKTIKCIHKKNAF